MADNRSTRFVSIFRSERICCDLCS